MNIIVLEKQRLLEFDIGYGAKLLSSTIFGQIIPQPPDQNDPNNIALHGALAIPKLLHRLF